MKKTFTFLLLGVFSSLFSQIQQDAPWVSVDKQRKNSKLTLQEISKNAESYFNTINRNKKGSGLKPFKRWEYHWSHYLKPDGTIAPAKDLWNAWEQKKALNKESARTDNSNWQPLGPYTNSNTYNATNLKQTGQGRINAIAVDPTNSNTIYIGAPAGGIWKSTDGGLNWTPLTDHLPQIGVSGIAIHPTNSNIIYIATGDDDASDSYSVGVWKSTDGGGSWNKTGLMPGGDPNKMNEIYINPNAPETILVATSSGVMKSTNGGDSWLQKLSGNILDLKMKPGDANIWYAASRNRFYKSTNGGEMFSNVTISGLTSSTRLTFDVTVANPNYVYLVSAGSGNSFNGVYKSTDSGDSFTRTAETSNIFNSTQAWYDLALTVSAKDENIVYVGVLDIWKSTNGGDRFQKMNDWSNPNTPSYTHADIHFLRFIDGKFFAGTDGGIFVSTNEGTSFTDLTKNLAISQFYRISVSPQKVDVIAGGLQDNGGFGYDGNKWRNYHGADGMEGIVDPNKASTFYGFIQFGGRLNISTDSGRSNSASISAPSQETSGSNDRGGKWITPLAINKEGELYAGYSQLYKLENNQWVKISNIRSGGDFDRLVIDPNNSDYIYMTKGSTMYKSIDRGQNFTIVSFSNGTITSIEVSKGSSDLAWITTRDGVFKSTNFTSASPTFNDITKNLPSEQKTVIKHHKRSSNNTVYLGTNLGVYFINDDLNEWQTFDNGLPNVQVRDLEINENDSKLYAGTYGRGIFSTNISRVLPANDVRVLEILNIENTQVCNTQVSPAVKVKNEGTETITNITFNYSVNSVNKTFNWSGNLASEADTEITLPEINSNTIGNQKLTIEASVSNDAYSDNNSISVNFIANKNSEKPTTVNSFENDTDKLIVETSGAEMWTLGNTNKTLLSVPSGSKAYSTTLTGEYPTQTTGYLYTNCYDLSVISNPVFKFKMGFDIEKDWDYLVVEYSTNEGANWSILGSADDPNWYNSNATTDDSGQSSLPGKQWTGEGENVNPSDNLTNATNKEYSYDLTSLGNEKNIIFRFKFVSDAAATEEGVVIDDLVISGVLSTEKNTLLGGIAIYPNPSESVFNINRNNSDKLSIRIFDITGKLVFSKKNISKTNYSLDLSNHAKGIYLLNMISNGKIATKKLVLK